MSCHLCTETLTVGDQAEVGWQMKVMKKRKAAQSDTLVTKVDKAFGLTADLLDLLDALRRRYPDDDLEAASDLASEVLAILERY
jgi:hypothetical protein